MSWEGNAMQKTYKIEVDCANCARKMEEACKKVEGVAGATVSFMTQKMVLAADDSRFDAILAEAVKTARRIEPDFEIEL